MSSGSWKKSSAISDWRLCWFNFKVVVHLFSPRLQPGDNRALIPREPAILQHGILSHTLAAELAHDSVAMPEIQAIRQNKQIPGARRLHDYANLYFDAQNAMLSRVRGHNSAICVLHVEAGVLDLPGVIVTDRNAASGWVSFLPADQDLEAISRDRLFARSWKHPEDMYDEMSHKSEKCAEALVPDRVEARFVMGAYVANQTALAAFQALETGLPVRIRGDMFF